MTDNTTRALKQAVSVDGWIGKFDEEGIATVHADVIFRQGAFGSDPESPVRFKIALRRAEVVIRVPNHEPLLVIKSSAARSDRGTLGTKKKRVTTKLTAAARVKGILSRKPDAYAEAEGAAEHSRQTDLETEESVLRYIEQHFWTEDGHCAFEVKPQEGVDNYLDGAPWNAAEAPRLSLKRTAERNLDGDVPSVWIEVRCAREDIEIIDLEQKNPEWRDRLRAKRNRDTNIAAAEQIIKDELQRLGFLNVPDLSEKYQRLLIADKIIFEDPI